jgi:hypothetical protein
MRKQVDIEEGREEQEEEAAIRELRIRRAASPTAITGLTPIINQIPTLPIISEIPIATNQPLQSQVISTIRDELRRINSPDVNLVPLQENEPFVSWRDIAQRIIDEVDNNLSEGERYENAQRFIRGEDWQWTVNMLVTVEEILQRPLDDFEIRGILRYHPGFPTLSLIQYILHHLNTWINFGPEPDIIIVLPVPHSFRGSLYRSLLEWTDNIEYDPEDGSFGPRPQLNLPEDAFESAARAIANNLAGYSPTLEMLSRVERELGRQLTEAEARNLLTRNTLLNGQPYVSQRTRTTIGELERIGSPYAGDIRVNTPFISWEDVLIQVSAERPVGNNSNIVLENARNFIAPRSIVRAELHPGWINIVEQLLS